MPNMQVSNKLRQLRRERGLTMQQLAELCGTSQQQIDRLEKGQRRMTVEWMVRLSDALGCDMFDLVPPAAQSRRAGITSKAKVIGAVNDDHSIEMFPPERRYSILFRKPEAMPGRGLFALVVQGSANGFSRGTELVFSEVDRNDTAAVRYGQTVLCAAPGNSGAVYFLEKAPPPDNDREIKAVLVKSIRDEW